MGVVRGLGHPCQGRLVTGSQCRDGLRRKAVRVVIESQGQRIGLALILSLMTLAFYVDIARLLG